MTNLGLQGTNIKVDNRMFSTAPPSILVATPGRLNDHLENGFVKPLMRSLKVLIFDEADQLLDMGFRPAIEKMLRMLPAKETRQTLMFSATMPSDVQGEMASTSKFPQNLICDFCRVQWLEHQILICDFCRVQWLRHQF